MGRALDKFGVVKVLETSVRKSSSEPGAPNDDLSFEFDLCTATRGASRGGIEHCNASASRGICHMSFVSTAPDATSESFMAQARLTRAARRANMVGERARVEMCHRGLQQSEASGARGG